jgi:hypothetical protein
MDTNNIVSEIDAEISRLHQVRALLTGTSTTAKRKPGRPAGTSLPKKTKAVRSLSAEAREKIAAAQRARWAKSRKAAKKEVRNVAAPAAKKEVRNAAAPAASANGVVPKTAPAKRAISVKKAGQPKTRSLVTPVS